MADPEHKTYCDVWVTQAGILRQDNTRKCNCGEREKWHLEQVKNAARTRALRPLGMSDAEFLRTLRINPEES
jgi:hypothetical protein